MAGGSEPSGVSTYTGTLAASTVDTVTFADRFGYVTVYNAGTTVLYATGDGSTPATSGVSGIAIPPGQYEVVANGLMTWYQSSKVIPLGAIQVGDGAAYNASTNPSTTMNPGTVTPMASLAGQLANPGTTIKLISTGTPTYTVAGTG